MGKTVIIYGVLMALTVAIYKYLEFQYIARTISNELTITLIALLFAGAGIWFGLRFRNNKVEKISLKPRVEISKKLGITERELEVLELLAEGLSNQEIATKLFISLPTVKTHSYNLYAKLQAKRRTQAIEKARNLGLLYVQTEV
jgi:DNA-binding NarL/FixJ family response regulator